MASLNTLYLVLAVCVLVLTIVLVVLGLQFWTVLRDVSKISENIEQISNMIERIATVVFPGIEKAAKRADNIQETITSFIEKKFDKFK